MRFRRIPPSRAMLRRELHDKSSSTRIAQGLFFLVLGAIIVFVNLNTGNSIQKTTGHISNEYEHTVNSVYDANWLELTTSGELYVFDKNVFTPPWNENKIFKGQRVDIYYLDAMPKQLVALQLYDVSGNSEQEFITPYFKAHFNQPPQITVPFIIGICMTIFGLCWFWWGIWLFAVRRMKSTLSATTRRPSSCE